MFAYSYGSFMGGNLFVIGLQDILKESGKQIEL